MRVQSLCYLHEIWLTHRPCLAIIRIMQQIRSPSKNRRAPKQIKRYRLMIWGLYHYILGQRACLPESRTITEWLCVIIIILHNVLFYLFITSQDNYPSLHSHRTSTSSNHRYCYPVEESPYTPRLADERLPWQWIHPQWWQRICPRWRRGSVVRHVQ